MKKYADYVDAGLLAEEVAKRMQAARDCARENTVKTLTDRCGHGLPVDAVAFGMLDEIACSFVCWFGAEDAATVFRHYADVCARQTGEGGAA